MSKIQSISQTAAAGDVSGSGPVEFDDLTKVVGFPYAFRLDINSPIQRIDFTGVDRIKGMRVTYRTTSGPHVEIHGATPPQGAPHLELTDQEILINIAGRSGVFNGLHSVLQLTFVSLNKETGQLVVHGPYGDKETDEKLFYAAGTVVAFAGRASSTALSAISIAKGTAPLDDFEL